jgi:hypothetical protein
VCACNGTKKHAKAYHTGHSSLEAARNNLHGSRFGSQRAYDLRHCRKEILKKPINKSQITIKTKRFSNGTSNFIGYLFPNKNYQRDCGTDPRYNRIGKGFRSKQQNKKQIEDAYRLGWLEDRSHPNRLL